MSSRNAFRTADLLNADEDLNVVTLERLERRLGEACGALQVAIVNLRSDMSDRNADLLRWLLAFFVAQTAALAALLAALR